ncbi:MAG TPA: glycosyltransferase family 87 protein [Candidatus Binataceae bacterium]|nr:glycosyltransferase family 87 protein [Candidatus Binataceae bacterium]
MPIDNEQRSGLSFLNDRLIAGALAALALAYALFMLLGLRARVGHYDFSTFYIWSSALRAGLNPFHSHSDVDAMVSALHLQSAGLQVTVVEGTKSGLPLDSYTPIFLLLFEPLTLLGTAGAYWTWTFINAGLFGATLFLLFGRAPRLSTAAKISLASLAILYPPLGQNFFWGQAQIPLLFLIVVAMRCLESGRDAAAGLAIALAGLIKVFPLAVLPYLALRRRWRAIGYTIAGLATGGIVSLVMVGPERSIDFVASYAGRSFFNDERFSMSIGSHVWRLHHLLTGNMAQISSVEAFTIASIAGVVMIVLAALATRRESSPSATTDPAFGLWIAAIVLLTPTSWLVYLVFLIVPYAQLAFSIDRFSAPRRAVWLGIASYAVAELAPRAAHLFNPGGSPAIAMFWQEVYALSAVLAFASAYYLAMDLAAASQPSMKQA